MTTAFEPDFASLHTYPKLFTARGLVPMWLLTRCGDALCTETTHDLLGIEWKRRHGLQPALQFKGPFDRVPEARIWQIPNCHRPPFSPEPSGVTLRALACLHHMNVG